MNRTKTSAAVSKRKTRPTAPKYLCPQSDADLLAVIARFRRLTAEQKIRATLLNNQATRRLGKLGAGKFHRPD